MWRSLPAEPAELLCRPVLVAGLPGPGRPGGELYYGPSRHRGLIWAALGNFIRRASGSWAWNGWCVQRTDNWKKYCLPFLRRKDSSHPAYVKIRSLPTHHDQIGETAFPRSKNSSSTGLHFHAGILIPRNLWLVVQAELSRRRRHVIRM